MSEVWKIILIILLSSVKFVAGPPFAYFDKRHDFTFFETVLYTVVGGLLGVIVFTFFSKPLFNAWHWIVEKVKKIFSKKQIFDDPVADAENIHVNYVYVDKHYRKKKIFSKRNRRFITIWRKYGLYGIAFLTPVIISIPIGTLIANSLVNNRKKIILYMFVSLVFWSVLMTSLFEVFHANNINDLTNEMSK